MNLKEQIAILPNGEVLARPGWVPRSFGSPAGNVIYELTRNNHDGTLLIHDAAETPKRFTFGSLKEALGPKPTTNCKNCAAPLNWHKEACEYCGTFFK